MRPRAGGTGCWDDLRRLMTFAADGGLTWRRTDGCPETYYSYNFLKRLFELKRFDWICAGLQAWTEEMLSTWVRNCIAGTGIRSLALSGGVFMNVKANKAISELPEVGRLFVYPSCGDETNAMGAAYWLESDEGKRRRPHSRAARALLGPFVRRCRDRARPRSPEGPVGHDPP